MGKLHYRAKFRGLASREELKGSTRGALKFQKPVWKEIELFDVAAYPDRNVEEERAGIFFTPFDPKKPKDGPIITFKVEENLKITTKSIQDLICFPTVGPERLEARHQRDVDFSFSNPDWIIWEGEARFSYHVPDPPKKVITESGEVVEEPPETPKGPNKRKWWEPKTKVTKPSKNIGKKANRWFPWLIFIIGLGLLFVNPILGVLALGWSIFLLSRKKKTGIDSAPAARDEENQAPGGETVANGPGNSSENNTEETQSGSSNSGEQPTGGTAETPNTGLATNRRLGALSIFLILLACLMLLGLWSINSSLFWPFALATFLYIIAHRNASNGWFIASRIFFFLLFFLSALLLLGSFVDTSSLLPDTRGDGNAKTERVKRDGSEELANRHTITWQNPIAQGTNEVTYYTGDVPYEDSFNAHQTVNQISTEISPQQYWGQVYTKLLTEDYQKIDSLAREVVNVSKKRNYNTLETAEYLVSLIQEIPYVLVHDYSCQEVVNSSGGFVREYHIKRKPCLPNIVAGVQSPYEFMHTLKGDCDTRSLLAHAVLRKLQISSSIWISEEFGHSIVGIGVPSTSKAKKVLNGVPHYGVELTAKGYRVGMISPQQMNMNYWDIALFKNY